MNRALVLNLLMRENKIRKNKPGKFTVKFIPELFLENNKQHFLALDHLSMTASWHNIRPEYENNKLVISKDGENWEQSLFQQEFLIMMTSMNLFTKELEKLTMNMEFLFYSI